MTNKIKQNHMKLIISIFIILCFTIIGILTYLMTVPYSKIPQYIENEMNNGLSFTRDGDVPIDGIKGYTLGRDYKIVQSKFDYFQPVYAMVVSSSSDEKSENLPIIRVRQIYLQRQGLDNWKVTKYLDNQVNGLNYKEVTDLASRYDLTTDFPGKGGYKITNYPPLTQAEIEQNRKVREESETIQKTQDTFNSLDTKGKLESKKKDLEKGYFIRSLLVEGKTTYPDGKTLEVVELVKTQKEQIEVVDSFLEQIKQEIISLENQLK
jgi:hypothetical protein